MAKRPTRKKTTRKKTTRKKTTRKKTSRRPPAGGGKSGKKRTRRKKKRRTRRTRSRRSGSRLRRGLAYLFVVASIAFCAWLFVLDRQISAQFEGKRWQVPARVFAQPLELYAGLTLSAGQLRARLDVLGYRAVSGAPRPGQYTMRGERVHVVTRPFTFWDGDQPGSDALVTFDGDTLQSLQHGDGDALPLLRLDPALIGSIVPGSGEDRIVVDAAGVPSLLPQALVAVEDQKFYGHHGLDLGAIARAAWINLRAGAVRQGGSTLTQQLVKSFFLDNRRTFRRKAREALMAVLLDARYDKAEIMLGYVNEIYMGQDGARAVHGFGLASRFYFGRPLAELETHQIALLVAMVRGPSLYDPRRNPERARERRDLVLDLLARRDVLSAPAAAAARARPLDVTTAPGRASGRYPAFMDVVRRQLLRDYRVEDLNSTGLNVFTTLDDGVQARAETVCAEELARVERAAGIAAGSLELGAVVSDPHSGELLALVGGRRPGYAGFNRAVSARRPIGSLIKPAVFLTAMEEGDYHLVTTLMDAPLEVRTDNGKIWAPRNYADEYTGEVPLYRALAESINVATVRAGLDVGPARVARQLRRLGVAGEIAELPSLLLGAIDLSPLEVAEMYGSFASGGYHVPARAVRAVVDDVGRPLRRYGLSVDSAAGTASIAQLNSALTTVMTHGTGRGAQARLPAGLTVAGKSGTSNDLRDGWFAGFSGDRLAVVWVGRDDNAPMGLSASRSALPVWSALMATFAREPFAQSLPDSLLATDLDYSSGALSAPHCGDTVLLPLPRDADVPVLPGCRVDARRNPPLSGIRKWLRDRFGD